MSTRAKPKPKPGKKRAAAQAEAAPATVAPATVAPAEPKKPAAPATAGPVSREDIDRFRENLQGEIDAVALYSVLMEKESSQALREFYCRMVEVEEVHAGVWRKNLEAAGVDTSRMRPAWRAKVLMFVARRFGPGMVVSTIAGREAADEAMYDDQPEALARMPGDERSHARLFRELASSRGVEGAAIARIEGRHRGAGGNQLRAAVLGANDGLVSNLSISMGVAGASEAGHAVLVAGLAGMLAGALSMAIGEWLSVQSARELYAHQVKVERDELLQVPDEEEEELALIYQAKGLTSDQARLMSKSIIGGDIGHAVDTLAREELGIDPDELGGSAWVAAATSFFLFAAGAVVPVLPFFFATGMAAVVASIIVSALALMVVGAAITVVTGSGVLKTGGRQVLLGLMAAAVTFGLGSLVGHAVG
jgi:VIT1/CCC1 family predicted Fe2+/Mn2+ transporter/demethoxyubiquinone hydroxylase (CLK1/Coq7/Cat5 family)